MIKNEQNSKLQAEYRQLFSPIHAYRNQVWEVQTKDFFQSFIPTTSVILELGCGWGEFINNIRAGQKHAMDLNTDTGSKLNQGITLHPQDGSLPWTIGEGALDVVFTSNFLEHLANKDQLATVLHQAYHYLKPGGRLLCLGPNIKYTGGEYWGPWDHHIPLTDAWLGEILELTGFRVALRMPRFLPFLIATGFHPPLIFLKTYPRLLFAWPVFEKQYFIIAEKTA